MAGDGFLFRGRGFVQLTGRANYRKAGDRLGLDLVKNPDDALNAATSAAILVKGCMEGWFTGKRLGDYASFNDMRRVVNGTDKAALIAGYAEKFLTALNTRAAAPSPPREPAPQPAPKSPLAAIVAVIVGLAAAAYAYLKSNGLVP